MPEFKWKDWDDTCSVGSNIISSVKDQNTCENSCDAGWAFAATANIEAMY